MTVSFPPTASFGDAGSRQAASPGDIQNPKSKTQNPKLESAARQFVNGAFLSALIKAMRKTVPEGELLHGGRGEEIFREHLDAVLVQRMSDRLATPVAEALIRQTGLTA
jgi:Rod binding domain-containing protein